MKKPNFTKKHYTDNYLCFQEEKINKLGKTDLLELLKNPQGWLYVLIKEDVFNMFIKTKGFFDFYINFDDLYAFSVETTIIQLNKRYFFDIYSDKNIKIIKKIKSRLVNNMRNFFSNKRKCSHDNVKSYIYATEGFYDKTDEIIEELDLFKIDMNQISVGLKKLWSEVLFNDDSFDYYDFKYLCNKFDLDLLYLLIYRPYILTHMMKIPIKNKNYSQLTLLFDYMEEVA